MFSLKRAAICAGFALALVSPLHAATLEGLVVGVADGDTLTVRGDDRRQHRVRLAGIDAPEKRQDFGQRSKQSLSELAYRQHVRVEVAKEDRYGRSVGTVLRGTLDVNLEQVRRGLAWHYKQYQHEQRPADREAYAAAEDEARASRRGLWSMPQPTAPWAYRRHPRSGAPEGRTGAAIELKSR